MDSSVVMGPMASEPSFEMIADADKRFGERLLIGVTHLGMAGVTAADYLVRHLEFDLAGYVESRDFPAIAPFEAGEPRDPIRLYASEEADLTVLVGESFVPVWAAERFVDGLLDWMEASPIEDVAVMYGVPFPHGPEQHRVFYTATPEFRETHLQNTDVEPLAGGFLDGVVAELVLRSHRGSAPPTGVFTTPTHPPGPDLEAALMFLDVVGDVYEVDVDEDELREQADRMKQYYNELASRMEQMAQGGQPFGSRDYPEDSMFM